MRWSRPGRRLSRSPRWASAFEPSEPARVVGSANTGRRPIQRSEGISRSRQLRIVVCVKRVPDTETRIRVAADGRSIDPSGVKWIVSPYDEFALEGALRTRDALGGEVVVVTVGEEAAAETLRSALAMGADRAVLLKGESGQDGLAVAKALAVELGEMGFDLALLGLRAVDDDQHQVGPMLATLLERACATAVSEFSVDGDVVTCEREVEEGMQVQTLPIGSVLTITKGAFEPRYPSLKGIMEAKKKPLEIRDAAEVQPRITVESLELPPARAPGRIVGEGPEAVPELVRLLREEARVL